MHPAIKTILPMLAFAWAGAGEAATYYVRNGGDDSADGRSPGTAWASLGKVNSYGFAAGDVVLLEEGSRFVGTVTVDWAGTSSARSVLGAYYLDGSTPVRGYRTERPIIDGEDRLPSSGHYGALVSVRANYVRVENLRVEDSEGRAIAVSDFSNAQVVGCYVSNAYNAGVHILKAPNALAENNFVTGAGVGNQEDGVPWGAAIELVGSNDAIVRNNTVSETFGEGINAHTGSQNALIERNTVFGVRAVGIYLDTAPDATVRRNVIVGTTNSTYWRGASTVGAGIALNNESYHYPVGGGSLSTSVQARRAKIYANLVAFTSTGIAVWGQLPESTFDGMLIFNNTLVDNNTQFSVMGKPQAGAKFINNVLLSLSSGTQDIGGGTSLKGMVAKNNYFSRGNPGGDYTSAGNRFTGLSLVKMSGWRAISSRTQVSWRDFVLAKGATAITAGDDEPRQMADLTNNYDLDHNAASHNTPMDMGGLTFSTPAGPRPMAPEALSGT
jgi:parallel beta helix pectate lyase-like protein